MVFLGEDGLRLGDLLEGEHLGHDGLDAPFLNEPDKVGECLGLQHGAAE